MQTHRTFTHLQLIGMAALWGASWPWGRAVAQVPNLVKASWTSLVVDEPGRDRLLRRPVAEAGDVDEELLDLLRHGRILQD